MCDKVDGVQATGVVLSMIRKNENCFLSIVWTRCVFNETLAYIQEYSKTFYFFLF